MEKVRPWCGQPSDGGRLRNRTEQNGGYGCNFSPGEGLSPAEDADNVARCADMMLCGSRIWYDRIDSVLPSTL